MNPSSVPGSVEVRIQNASSMDFDSVRVVFPDGVAVDYGAVASGQYSHFSPAKRAYRYAPIEASAGGRKMTLNPIDYSGERELDPGRYTYVLRVAGSNLAIDVQKVD